MIGKILDITSMIAKYTNTLGKPDVTGPSTANKGIFIIYDIFSWSPQILQGADILSTSDKNQQYQVFMPDFLDGKLAEKAWYVIFPAASECEKESDGMLTSVYA